MTTSALGASRKNATKSKAKRFAFAASVDGMPEASDMAIAAAPAKLSTSAFGVLRRQDEDNRHVISDSKRLASIIVRSLPALNTGDRRRGAIIPPKLDTSRPSLSINWNRDIGANGALLATNRRYDWVNDYLGAGNIAEDRWEDLAGLKIKL